MGDIRIKDKTFDDLSYLLQWKEDRISTCWMEQWRRDNQPCVSGMRLQGIENTEVETRGQK